MVHNASRYLTICASNHKFYLSSFPVLLTYLACSCPQGVCFCCFFSPEALISDIYMAHTHFIPVWPSQKALSWLPSKIVSPSFSPYPTLSLTDSVAYVCLLPFLPYPSECKVHEARSVLFSAVFHLNPVLGQRSMLKNHEWMNEWMGVYNSLKLVYGVNYIRAVFCSHSLRAWIYMCKYSICYVESFMLRLLIGKYEYRAIPGLPSSLIKKMNFNKCWAGKYNLE